MGQHPRPARLRRFQPPPRPTGRGAGSRKLPRSRTSSASSISPSRAHPAAGLTTSRCPHVFPSGSPALPASWVSCPCDTPELDWVRGHRARLDRHPGNQPCRRSRQTRCLMHDLPDARAHSASSLWPTQAVDRGWPGSMRCGGPGYAPCRALLRRARLISTGGPAVITTSPRTPSTTAAANASASNSRAA